MKRRALGLLAIPFAMGAISLVMINTNKAHAEAATKQASSATQSADMPEPGDTPDQKKQNKPERADTETRDD